MIILCFAVVVAIHVQFCDSSYRLNFPFISKTPRFRDRPCFLRAQDSETLVCNKTHLKFTETCDYSRTNFL